MEAAGPKVTLEIDNDTPGPTFATCLAGAQLSGVTLRGIRLTGANLSEAHLRGADLNDLELTDASFTGADLGYAKFSGLTSLAHVDLTDADLRGTPFAPHHN